MFLDELFLIAKITRLHSAHAHHYDLPPLTLRTPGLVGTEPRGAEDGWAMEPGQVDTEPWPDKPSVVRCL